MIDMSDRHVGFFHFAAAGLVAALLIAACSPSPTTPPPAPSAHSQQLWGDMKPVVSVKELMRDMIDPLSDNVFRRAPVTLDAILTALEAGHPVLDPLTAQI